MKIPHQAGKRRRRIRMGRLRFTRGSPDQASLFHRQEWQYARGRACNQGDRSEDHDSPEFHGTNHPFRQGRGIR